MANRFAFLQDASSDSETDTETKKPQATAKTPSSVIVKTPKRDLVVTPKTQTPPKAASKVATNPKTSVRPGKAKKTKATTTNNAFALLQAGESSSDSEESSDSDSWMAASPQKEVVATPIQTNQQQQNVDYYAVLNLVSSVGEEKVPSEVLHFALLFLNAKTKQPDFDFQMFVYPSSRKVSAETTALTGIAIADVNAGQPLDEVLRQMTNFLKSKNLVSANRKTKKPQPLHLQELSFHVVADTAEMKNLLLPDIARQAIGAPTFFKKWVDLRKTFEGVYDSEGKSTEDMLHQLCLSSLPVPEKYQMTKINWAPTFDLLQVMSTLLSDHPTPILANEGA